MPTQVLLVDDDEFARSFARTVLERAGFEVHEAEDIAAALATAESLHPTAVVTDWNLPDGNGGHLARSLHATSEQLPVILVTGSDTDSDSEEEAIREFVSILHKPYSPSALEKAIRAVTQH
jgi:DNA-binding response OmpR family regulator